MKLSVLSKRPNPALRREELTAAIDYEGGPTPAAAAVRAGLAKTLGVPEDRIEMVKLLSAAGKPAGTAWLRVWEAAELVPKPKVKKAAVEKK